MYGPKVEVAFLEEDHYVSTDYLLTLRHLTRRRGELCPDCVANNLGYHKLTVTEFKGRNLDLNLLDPVEMWNTSRYGVVNNIGLSFNRTLWQQILDNISDFCDFNDYNWDNSLIHMSQLKRIAEPSFTVGLTRVYHIGVCGMHKKSGQCDPTELIKEYDSKIVRKIPTNRLNMTSMKQDWHENPYSTWDYFTGSEGWTSGRLWDRDHEGQIKEFWFSQINSIHCHRVSNGFGVTHLQL
jgi:alpha-1,6-mannosyl-glycoprotein beta-1,2-N-acetylglucosaminyltransferase